MSGSFWRRVKKIILSWFKLKEEDDLELIMENLDTEFSSDDEEIWEDARSTLAFRPVVLGVTSKR